MKTRETLICWPAEWEHKQMTEDQIDDLVKDRQEHIRATFRWENYPDRYTHLVVCVRYTNEPGGAGKCVIYPQGYLMDDREFNEKVAYRTDLYVGRVIAYHKGTAVFR